MITINSHWNAFTKWSTIHDCESFMTKDIQHVILFSFFLFLYLSFHLTFRWLFSSCSCLFVLLLSISFVQIIFESALFQWFQIKMDKNKNKFVIFIPRIKIDEKEVNETEIASNRKKAKSGYLFTQMIKHCMPFTQLINCRKLARV